MEPNNLNEWWGGQPDGLKQAFSLFTDGRWKEADLYLRINIRNYCLLKKGGLLPEDRTARCSARLSVSWPIRSCAVQMERHSKHVRYGRGFSGDQDGESSGTVQPDIR